MLVLDYRERAGEPGERRPEEVEDFRRRALTGPRLTATRRVLARGLDRAEETRLVPVFFFMRPPSSLSISSSSFFFRRSKSSA